MQSMNCDRFAVGLLTAATYLALTYVAFGSSGSQEGDLVITNARLYDGTGAPIRENISIEIEAGRVVSIKRGASNTQGNVLDVSGAIVMPGLIDSHVHLALVPGAGLRDDPPELTRELIRAHLRGYLASGVTTVLDTGIPVNFAREIRAWLKSGNPGPNVYFLAPFLTPAGGYGTDPSIGISFRGFETERDIEELFDEAEILSPVGVKVAIEFGFGVDAVFAVPDSAARKAIASLADQRGLPIYVHGSSEKENRIGLEMGAHALVHALFETGEPSESFIQHVATNKVYVIPTFSVDDSMLMAIERERIEDPLVQLVVPEIEIDTASDPESWKRLARIFARGRLGTAASEIEVERIGQEIESLAWAKASIERNQAAVRRLHTAGAPIVVGSDSGNWPVIPYVFHGPTTIREMELLEEAGLTPHEVLRAATYTPAEMLGLSADIGTIEIGKRADLIICDTASFEHVSVLRALKWVVKDGVAKTPAQWMKH